MNKLLDQAISKMAKTALSIQDAIPYVAKNKHYDDWSNRPSWWTNGFYPGILWHLYQKTNDVRFADISTKIEQKLDIVLDSYKDVDHDAGFIWLLSSVNRYRFTKDDRARIQGLKAASFLASRYHPKGEYIRAWNGDWARGHAIIDSLMNLSILFWASKELQDDGFYQIAMKQANTAVKEFIREDGSVFHIVVFDEITGRREGQRSGQGYSEQSSWGRGTSWAIYGFALAYRETKEQIYLDTAKKIACFIQNHMPADCVPYADYLAPDEPLRKKDSSAGAITACGFLLLGELTGESQYRDYAEKILNGLHSTYLAPEDHEAILLHGNVAYHASDESDTDLSIIYGDYFYLEALMMANGYHGFF